MADVRVLRTAKATLSRTFYLDEEGASASGAVNVSVTRMDGTVVESGSAAPDGAAYSYTFSGRDVVDLLTVSWSGTFGGDAIVIDSDRIEVVGGFYFSLSEGRGADRVLSDPAKFPTAKLIEKRAEVEAECERLTGQAWVPRFARETLSGTGGRQLVLRHPLVRAVRSVTVGGVVGPAPYWTPQGVLIRDAGWPVGFNNVVVEYEHGHDSPNPEIVRAAKLRFKSLMLEDRSALPDRAERVVTVDQAGGSTVYASPTADKTGIPAVDAIYGGFPSPRPGFG